MGGSADVSVNMTTLCQACGSTISGTGHGDMGSGASGTTFPASSDRIRCAHADLVRSVALGEEFVLSGSYDLSIKVSVFLPFPSFSKYVIQ